MQYLFWPPSTRLEKRGGNSLLYCKVDFKFRKINFLKAGCSFNKDGSLLFQSCPPFLPVEVSSSTHSGNGFRGQSGGLFFVEEVFDVGVLDPGGILGCKNTGESTLGDTDSVLATGGKQSIFNFAKYRNSVPTQAQASTPALLHFHVFKHRKASLKTTVVVSHLPLNVAVGGFHG